MLLKIMQPTTTAVAFKKNVSAGNCIYYMFISRQLHLAAPPTDLSNLKTFFLVYVNVVVMIYMYS